jgi:NhaP-type Na+/H+ or K+/H+ antiporter
LLFGEGVLNDAVSILLFRSVLKGDAESSLYAVTVAWTALFLLFSSTLIGLAVGLGISRLLKVNTGLNNHPTRQTIIIVLGCYVSYALAELLDVNGVLSVFVCGIIFSHFAWHSLAPEAKIGTVSFLFFNKWSEAVTEGGLGSPYFTALSARLVELFM